jgi:DNA-binding transcriptional LysR family regulator
MSVTPPLRKLQYVLAVAHELHFGKAAERLHVDPSTLSRQIREVEEEVGIQIFLRKNHYVALTEEGALFVLALEQELARFIAEFEKAKDLARLRARRKASSFVIGYSPFVVPFIPNHIRSVHSRRFPSIHLEMQRASVQELTDSLIAEARQACVIVRPTGTRYFEEIRLGSERLFAVWPRAYQTYLSGAIALTDLRAHPLVLPCSHRTDPALQRWFFDRCAAADFKPKVAAEASTPPEAFNLVQDGVGIAVMPGGVCADASPNLVCAPIGGIDALEIILTWRSDVSYRVQKMVTEIGSELRRLNLEIAS